MNRKTKSWISAGLLAVTLMVNALGASGIIKDPHKKKFLTGIRP